MNLVKIDRVIEREKDWIIDKTKEALKNKHRIRSRQL